MLSFHKKETPDIKVIKGDGFPMKVIFNGKECALPKRLPKKNGSYRLTGAEILSSVLVVFLTFVVNTGRGRHRRKREAWGRGRLGEGGVDVAVGDVLKYLSLARCSIHG
ncbi:hypothetical protein L6452_09712 [Arctium lappa]|uniref:Uncharacterized protein n=1 Tax=Arctium lappa TaxID=4217 RepID=A0ACB9DKU2_ARCLA|nr:hypothetical protein L6452_09712 [Arctium lappa]